MPFAGCPNKCSFCDQHKITGQVAPTTPDDVKRAIEIALSSDGIDTKTSEIAFFGGSFTAIDRDYMISLLSAANEYVSRFKGIRISTRPDCINEDILSILKEYKVTSVELGAQSMCDEVLRLNRRGHNSNDVRIASLLIKEYGLSLGLQMMTGLYGSDNDNDTYTACEFIKLKPDTVRIYPTVILKGTHLAELYNSGEYRAQTVGDAADLCAELLLLFEENNIPVIRLGLHSSETMEENIISGAYHPAFRELCENRIFLNKTISFLSENPFIGSKVIIRVTPSAVSKLIGQKKSNIHILNEMGYDVKIISDDSLKGRQIIIQEG